MEHKNATDLNIDVLAQFPEENPNPVMLSTQGGEILYCNPSGQKLCRNHKLTDQNHFNSTILEAIQAVFNDDKSVSIPLGQNYYRVLSSHIPESNQMFLFWQEVTEQKRYEALLYLSESIIERTVEGVFITDESGIIERVNPAFTRITGYSAAEAIGAPPRILKSNRQNEEFYRNMWEHIVRNGYWEGEIWNRTKDGHAIPVWQSISVIENGVGELKKYVSIFHDISDIKFTEAKLEHQAYHDVLTGLPNRQLFLDRLQQAIAASKRNQKKTAVILLDIDNFKKINDSLGHNLGDKYLQIISERLTRTSREEDTIARLGGDEFALINLYISDQNNVLDILERVQETIAHPVILEEHELIPSASIGITFYPDDGNTAHELLQNADLAMYKAKLSEKGTYALFNSELQKQAQNRIELETAMRQALQNDQFKLYYQPKINPNTNEVCGVEALVRWDRKGTVVSPGEFIPIAEESGLILPLGRQILYKACKEIYNLHQQGFPEIAVAVNISGTQFQDASLINQIRSVLNETGIEPAKLNIEITENVAISDMESALHMIEELERMGINTAIDDFGTGYSSMAYIKRFKSHTLKIDKSFIDDLPGDQGDQAIIQAIITMSHALGMKVVAEGVETNAQVEYLKAVGCDYIQGYYYSKPLPLKELISRIDKNYILLM
jgi:diguanylate cyclase (GGDEF)-like protein/PAS domain S-box-containing protein